MGKELVTTVEIDGEQWECKVLLESSGIICRAPVRRTFALSELATLKAVGGRLEFMAGRERVAILLGADAAKWFAAIKSPRTRVQKLGVRAGMKVVALGGAEEDALGEIAEATGTAVGKRLVAGCDLVLLFAEEPDQLERLTKVRDLLSPKGAVWVLWPKARKDFAHEHVVAAASGAGLVQTKSMGFSERLTGLRLTRPART
ncbi:MAG: DUF3052 family protein [Phycisphaerales bacterium]